MGQRVQALDEAEDRSPGDLGAVSRHAERSLETSLGDDGGDLLVEAAPEAARTRRSRITRRGRIERDRTSGRGRDGRSGTELFHRRGSGDIDDLPDLPGRRLVRVPSITRAVGRPPFPRENFVHGRFGEIARIAGHGRADAQHDLRLSGDIRQPVRLDLDSQVAWLGHPVSPATRRRRQRSTMPTRPILGPPRSFDAKPEASRNSRAEPGLSSGRLGLGTSSGRRAADAVPDFLIRFVSFDEPEADSSEILYAYDSE